MVKNNLKLISGVSYLFIFISGIFANFVVMEDLFANSNIYQILTQNNVLFRVGIISFVVMVIFDLILVWSLNEYFKKVNESISRLSTFLRLSNCVIFAIAIFQLLDISYLINLNANLYINNIDWQIKYLFNSFNNIWFIGLIFFGLHLIFLGFLILKSSEITNVIAYLLIFAGLGYLVDSVANIGYANYNQYKDIFSTIVILPSVIGEFSLTIWFLVKSRK